jgi:murein DD-endopeptidase MepM/ murein hydrolase activator NlpD
MQRICFVLGLVFVFSLHASAQNASRASISPPLAVMGRISQPFGQSTNVFTGEPWFHDGIDIPVRMRTPVFAAMSGVVFETGDSKSLGNYLILDHENHYKTIYAQLDEITVVKGRRVVQGETIAFSGNTGMSTGPHLHFGVYLDDEALDPLSVLDY